MDAGHLERRGVAAVLFSEPPVDENAEDALLESGVAAAAPELLQRQNDVKEAAQGKGNERVHRVEKKRDGVDDIRARKSSGRAMIFACYREEEGERA